MTIKIKGKNYHVSRLCNSFENALKKFNMQFTIYSTPGAYPTSNVVVTYNMANCSFALGMLKDANVSVEIVEETLDTISHYESNVGCTAFNHTCEFKEGVYDYDEFEDFEMYYNRMQQIGVLM